MNGIAELLNDKQNKNTSAVMIRNKTLIAVGSALLLQAHAFGQDYHANDVTPAGAGSGKLTAAVSGKQVGGSQLAGSYNSHAVLLSGNAVTGVDLNPATASYSLATCADDFQQGGWAYLSVGQHAVVWSGSAASYADLHPSGYNFSYCLGVHNGEQVGYAQQQSYFISASHAYSWHGSAASGVDLHPVSIYPFSRAVGCRDGEEVGYVSTVAYPEAEYLAYYHTTSHAVRWVGTAASAVDLHPLGFDASEATCTSGTQQGGWGYIALGTSHLHALLWSGTADTVVDLHPAGYTESRINAMNATQQVGDGWVGAPGVLGSVRHALAWSGTADTGITVVDLNQYLPAGCTHGVATGIDANGNIVGYGYNAFQGGVSIQQGAVAVVFAPGAAPATQLASVTLDSANVVPGTTVQATVSLGGPAPAGGVNITFLSTSPLLVATPASLLIPEGDISATLALPTDGLTLSVPTNLKVYATDGAVSKFVTLTLTPVVRISNVTGNPVEGGFATYGAVTLSIPAQAGGAVVSLISGNTSLLAVPATLTIPQGTMSMGFTINTAPVSAITSVPITATFNGTTVTGSVSLNPAPVVALSSLSIPAVVGGQTVVGMVTLNNFPRSAAGAVVTLTSGDTGTLQVPATVTVPQGAYSAYFTATTVAVPGLKGVSVKATYNGGSLSTTIMVNPIPTVTIVSADWDPTTLLFKVKADTSYADSILTFGTDVLGPIGTMQLELGVWSGSILMATAPTTAVVWNSNGGQATMPVTIKGLASGGGGIKSGGGGGGGGGTTTTSSYKLSVSKTGKGTVTTSPVAASYAAGTVVTLTATPDVGSPWIGWSGSVVSKSQTISVTMNGNLSLTANFK